MIKRSWLTVGFISLGLLGMGNAVAANNCQYYVELGQSNTPPSTDFLETNQQQIRSCYDHCDTIGGNAVNAKSLQQARQCRTALSDLLFRAEAAKNFSTLQQSEQEQAPQEAIPNQPTLPGYIPPIPENKQPATNAQQNQLKKENPSTQSPPEPDLSKPKKAKSWSFF